VTPPCRVPRSFEPAFAGWVPPGSIRLGRSLSRHFHKIGTRLVSVGSNSNEPLSTFYLFCLPTFVSHLLLFIVPSSFRISFTLSLHQSYRKSALRGVRFLKVVSWPLPARILRFRGSRALPRFSVHPLGRSWLPSSPSAVPLRARPRVFEDPRPRSCFHEPGQPRLRFDAT
jgi:hypothetical protein